MTPSTYERFCILRDQRRAGEEAPEYSEKQAFAVAVLQLITDQPAPEVRDPIAKDCLACGGTNKACSMNCGPSLTEPPQSKVDSMRDCSDCATGCNTCWRAATAARASKIAREASFYRFLRSAAALQLDALWVALADAQEHAFDALVIAEMQKIVDGKNAAGNQ